MIKLYQFEVCPFCCKVKAVLDYKKLSYETIEVNPISKEEIAFAKPYGKVPILVDGNQTIVESNDIIQYLEDRYPDRSVFASQPEEQKKQKEWVQYADEQLVTILPPNIYRNFSEAFQSFKYITKVTKFSVWKRYFIAVGGAVAMTAVAKKKMKERGITDARGTLVNVLKKWETAFEGKSFRGGENPDVSDLVCYGILKSVRELKIWDFISEQTPKVNEWFERVRRSVS